ncbi:MAG TPA: MmcQ/YjbR family DNA-binding protein [Vicinamibacterales bacterium]|nr:MmcQ/YjbR family DNA-binding protein [Vicinamibacterales bacterium]
MTANDRTLARVRTLCLSLPETTETLAWGHPNFRAGHGRRSRVFVAFEQVKGRPSIAFRLSPTDVDLLLRRPSFFATPYGRGQWASVWADARVNWRLVGRLVRTAHRVVTSKR